MKIKSKMWSRLFVAVTALLLGASAAQAATFSGGPHNGTIWTGTDLQTIATADANQGANLYMNNATGYSQSFTADETMTVGTITLLTQRFASGFDFTMDVYELIGQGSSSPDPANSDKFRYSNAGHSTLLKSYSLNSDVTVGSGNRGDNYFAITLDAGEQFDVTAGKYYAVHIYTAGTGSSSDRLMIWDYSDQSSYAFGRYGTGAGAPTVEARDFGLAISAAPTPPVTLAPNADTHIRGTQGPTTNYGTSGSLSVRSNGPAPRAQYAYIRFDLTSYANIGAGASFGLTSINGTGWAGTQLQVYGLPDTAGLTAQDWVETTLTYNNTGTEFPNAVASDVDPLDVTNLVDLGFMPAGAGGDSVAMSNAALDAFLATRAGSTVTLIVANTYATDRAMLFGSREAANPANAPTLTFNADPAPAPETPTGLAAVAGGHRQIDLTWDATAWADGYNISIYNGTTTEVEAAAGPSSYTVTGLDAETQYTFKIAATNSSGDSAYSGDVIASTNPAYLYEFYTPAATVTPTIDGTFAAGEWVDAFYLEMAYPDLVTLPDVGTLNNTAPSLAAAADISGTVYFTWDATYLYIGFAITDDVFIASDGSRGYPADHVAISFNPDVTNTDTSNALQFEVWLNSTIDASSWLWPDSSGSLGLTDAAFAGTVDGSDWNIEMKLKWTEIMDDAGYVPALTDQFGICATIVDNDDGAAREAFLISSGQGIVPLGNPELWHTATLATVVPDMPYGEWITRYSVGGQTNESDDPDLDNVDNLTEFALGGDPSLSDAPSILPTSEANAAGNLFTYIYNRRINANALGLTYTVGVEDDLANVPGWQLGGVTETGAVAIDYEFEEVTNTVNMTEDNKFLRLEIDQAQ